MRPETSLAAIAFFALAAASCEPTAPAPDPVPASIVAVTGEVAAVPEYRKPVVVRVLDEDGRGLPDAQVQFEPAGEGHGNVNGGPLAVASTDGAGSAEAVWTLPSTPGDYELRATVTESDVFQPEMPTGLTVTVPAVVESFSPALDAMLLGLGDRIERALQRMQETLRLNPTLEAEHRARIALLKRPDLDSEIVAGRRFLEHPAPSIEREAIPVVTVFPSEEMRHGATRIGSTIEAALPVLEGFLDAPFPAEQIRVWYGFELGSSGGGGTINMEDEGGYAAREGPLPYDAIVYHEMAHSYIGNESLTQLLELIVYNVLRTGSTDLETWPYTRDYPGLQDSNEDLYALMDIHGLIGHDAVARGYRAVLPLPTPYGQPLCEACVQAFVDEAPAEWKAAVEAKARRVTF
ncbi:MAG: carboxypeptidase-like regulatory domain-containing protein [Gemmatimonadetes bacterium]|nr:carboxypeptidase-like regulatory domain-containing protein [Gemmatimonadota bacterium]